MTSMPSLPQLIERLSVVPHDVPEEALKADPKIMQDVHCLFQRITEASPVQLSTIPFNIQTVLGEIIVRHNTPTGLHPNIAAALFRSSPLRSHVVPYIAQFNRETRTLFLKNPQLSDAEHKEVFTLVQPEILAQTQHLIFEDCAIRDLDFVARMPSLETLVCRFCPFLKNVSALSRLHRLREITLFHCDTLASLNGLEGDFPLTKLDLEGCVALQSIRGIERFPLEELNVQNCLSLRTLSVIRALKSLQKLNIGNITRFDDVEILRSLPRLGVVHIAGSSIDPRALEQQPGLTIN